MQRRKTFHGKTFCVAASSQPSLVRIFTGPQALAQNDKKPRPSPPAQATVSFGSKTVTIDYSAPSMRGRKIFGELVSPYDHWVAYGR